jgi:hypothetical protein
VLVELELAEADGPLGQSYRPPPKIRRRRPRIPR